MEGSKDMSKGCQEGKGTPRLTEIVCPRCGDTIEVFVKMGGGVTETGRFATDEKCPRCGFVAEAGKPLAYFDLA